MITTEVKSKEQRIYCMFEQPVNWLEASLPCFQRRIQNRENCESTIECSDIRATIIVPIRNESRTIESVFASLVLSELPRGSHIQFIYVVNGCSDDDASYNRIYQLLAEICSEKLERLFIKEHGVSAAFIHKGKHVEHVLLKVQTPSKVNALSIGNTLAVEHRSTITVTVDANVWVEPWSLLTLLETADTAFRDSAAYVVGGKSCVDYRPSYMTRVLKRDSRSSRVSQPKLSSELHGCLMAWDTQWLGLNGGFPPVANDDYCLSLLTRLSGKEVIFADAAVWIYFPNTISGMIQAYSRTIRDRMQLASYFSNNPEVLDWITMDTPSFQPFWQRISLFLEQVGVQPHKFMYVFVAFVLWEYARYVGKLQFEADPYSQTWSEIISTK